MCLLPRWLSSLRKVEASRGAPLKIQQVRLYIPYLCHPLLCMYRYCANHRIKYLTCISDTDTGHDYGHHMSKAAANMMGALLAQVPRSTVPLP